jgi:23S rRNA pseudouridine2605 synthase
MCEAVGHPVVALERVAIGGLALGQLRPGASRRLTETEVAALLDAGSSAPNRGASPPPSGLQQ